MNVCGAVMAQLEAAGELRRIAAPVSPHLEMTALADRVRRVAEALHEARSHLTR